MVQILRLIAILLLTGQCWAQILQPAQGGTGVANTATLTLGSSNVNLATLGTGIRINTTTTGAQSVIAAVGTKCYPYQGSGGTGCDTPTGSGVISVGLVLPTNVFTVTGSPVTTSGTLTGSLNNQTAGYVWQGPPSTFQTPFLIQAPAPCIMTGAGNTSTCSYTSAVNAGDELVVHICVDNNDPSTSGITDNQGDTFTRRVRNTSSYACDVFTSPNAVGGSTTITATGNSGGNLGNGVFSILEYAGVAASSEFDAAGTSKNYTCSVNPLTFNAVTTSNAHDLILGFSFDTSSAVPVFGTGDGYRLDIASSGGTHGANGVVSSNVTSTGAYIPFMTAGRCNSSDFFQNDVISLKSLSSPISQTPIFAPISAATLAAGGLQVPLVIYSSTATGQTSAISDTTMLTSPTSTLYTFIGTINCTTTSAAATATLNLKYTDTASTAQTVSVTDTCTALVTTGVPNLNVALRAKTGTAITWGVTIVNTPTYDVDIRLETH